MPTHQEAEAKNRDERSNNSNMGARIDIQYQTYPRTEVPRVYNLQDIVDLWGFMSQDSFIINHAWIYGDLWKDLR